MSDYTPTPEHIYSPDVTEAEIRMWRAGFAQGQRDALTQAADEWAVIIGEGRPMMSGAAWLRARAEQVTSDE